MSKNVVINRTAKKLDLPEYHVIEIVNSFFELVVDDIESKEYKGSYCRRLGKFIIKPNRLKMLKEKQKLKEDGDKIRDNEWEGSDTTKLPNSSRTTEDLG
tara:strand:+ start:44 stop:343 length:300 start_codon:yes stop_codon:yes gene_type:complete